MKTNPKFQLTLHALLPYRLLSVAMMIVLFLGLSFQSNAQCPPNQPGCTDTQNFTAVVTVPKYPDCTLTVNYDLRFCQGEAQISNVTFTLDVLNCGPLISDVIAVFFNGDALGQERFLRDLIIQVETEIANQLFDAAVAGGPIELYYCGSGLNTFTASFYRGSCVSTCVSQNDKGGLAFTPISCGTTCCKKSIVYCIDKKTGETITEERIDQVIPGECFQFKLPECPKGTLFQSPCFELCEPE